MSDYLLHFIFFCFLSYMQVRQKHLKGKMLHNVFVCVV